MLSSSELLKGLLPQANEVQQNANQSLVQAQWRPAVLMKNKPENELDAKMIHYKELIDTYKKEKVDLAKELAGTKQELEDAVTELNKLKKHFGLE